MALHRRLGRLKLITIASMVLAVLVAGCNAPQTTFDPSSDATDKIHTLYILVIVVSGLIGTAVLIALAYLLYRFRARPGVRAKQIHGNNTLEIIWTILPILALVMVGVPTVFAIAGAQRAPSEDALHINVIGHQWWFEVEYPGLGPDGESLMTANEIHVPIGREVAIHLTSNDVIHSFWVPRLVGKTDMVPNHPNDLEVFTPKEIGVFYGQCAEFCGSAHAMMRFRVVVEPTAKFENWVEALQTAPEPSDEGTFIASGQDVFMGNCSSCHKIYGTAAQGIIGPDLTRFGSRLTLGAGILDNTSENAEAWIGNVRDLKPIPEGILGSGRPAMPTFNEVLSDAEIAAVSAYIRSQTVE